MSELTPGEGEQGAKAAAPHGDGADPRPRFGSVAVGGSIALAVFVALVTAAILFALLRIVGLAEKARDEVVPQVIEQQERAVMASELARVAERILGAPTPDIRSRALQEAEAIAHNFAQVAAPGVLARLDAAIHAVRRSAYRKDVLDALNESMVRHLRDFDTLLPPVRTTPPEGGMQALHLLFELRYTLHEVTAAAEARHLEDLETRFASLIQNLRDLPEGTRLPVALDKAVEVDELGRYTTVFDLRREYLAVKKQVEAETAGARRLLAKLSQSLSADAAALASQSSAEIVAYGRNGIVIAAVALGIGLLVMLGVVLFVLRHVVSPVLRASSALEAVQRGDRTVHLPRARFREFDRVSRSVERLARVLHEVKLKEQEALRSRQQLQFVFDVAPIPFLMTGLERSEVIDANEAACELLQVDRADVVGRVSRDFWMQPEQRDEMIAFLEREGRVEALDVHLMKGDGTPFWAVLSADMVELDSGRVLLVGLYDITERKTYEARLQSLVGELESSNRELEQFAYVASHDLQEPLRMVVSYLQLLEQRYGDKLDDDGREFVAYACSSARRMQKLIVDLLQYSRVGRNVQLAPVRVSDALDDARNVLKLALEEAGADLAVEDPLPEVSGDVPELARLFQNLLGNAMRYRSPDRPLKIRVSAQQRGGMWELAVADNGIGIAPEQTERAFQIFQRLHPDRSSKGTGIGLAICRKIVEHHGGRIWIDAGQGAERAGEGCTFRFTLVGVSRAEGAGGGRASIGVAPQG